MTLLRYFFKLEMSMRDHVCICWPQSLEHTVTFKSRVLTENQKWWQQLDNLKLLTWQKVKNSKCLIAIESSKKKLTNNRHFRGTTIVKFERPFCNRKNTVQGAIQIIRDNPVKTKCKWYLFHFFKQWIQSLLKPKFML
jgi:hypothetical protein